MEVKLISWRYKNIRGGLSDLDIELGNPPNRWTLIQMPNGMGKTTTMHLFRAAFTGEQLDADTVRSFRPSDTANTGEFELVISIVGQIYRLALQLNYETGTSTYQTSRAETQSGGKESGHHLPRELKSLLTPQFARLFIFDGELAKQIRDLNRQNAADAIRTLYRLDKLSELKNTIERLVDEQQRASSTTKAQTDQGLKFLRTRLDTVRAKLSDLKRNQRRLDSTLTDTRQRVGEVETQIRNHMQQDQDFRTRVNDLEAARTANDREVVSISKSTLSELRNPAAIHRQVIAELTDLGHKMQRLKLPKTMSLEFFFELAEQPTCVCGRSIGPHEKEIITATARNYLSEDQIGVVNAIKSAVRQYEQATTTFGARAKELSDRLKLRHKLNGDWDRLQTERVEAGDVELQRLKDEKAQLEDEIPELEEQLEALTSTDHAVQRKHGATDKTNIPLCGAEVRERQKALAEATGTVVFTKKAALSKDLIEEIENRALELIKERLRDATNKKLNSLIPTEGIRVARIGGALELESDLLNSKQQVSEGQSLAIAYAFLTSLFEQAPYKLPFIVDSPAGSLDLKVRKEVSELVPNLFDQMVIFVISSERNGFAEPFYDRHGVLYRTVWRDETGKTQTNSERKFFQEFHSEENDKKRTMGVE